MRYALVSDGIVRNIVVAESGYEAPQGMVAIAATAGAVKGGTWDGEDFGPAPAPPEPTPDFRITRLAFLNRYTQSERITIRTAAKQNAAIEDFMALVDAATFIDLSRADTIAGVNALEQGDLIGAGRADEILTDPIDATERPA